MLAPRATLINIAAVIDQVLLGDAPLNNLREVKRAVGAIHDALPPDEDIGRNDLHLEYLSLDQSQMLADERASIRRRSFEAEGEVEKGL